MKFIISFIFAIATGLNSLGAFPNDKVVVTDVLDDDIRAIVHLLAQSEKAKTIKAFITSTGNAQLKAAVLQRIVSGFGYNIPVYAGTSTDLTNNMITLFAGRYEMEGFPIIGIRDLKKLKKLKDHSGPGAAELANLVTQYQHQNKLDILLLTAPTDIVKAINANPEMFRAGIGDLFVMGLYKKNGNGELVAPYNTMADPSSVVELLNLYQKGIFERIIHVASDVVQNASGLPYGYVPADTDEFQVNKLITKAMTKNRTLNKILHAAEEYGLNWRDQAANQFGPGVGTDLDRWVPSSLISPKFSARFYLADMIPSILSTMTSEELDQQAMMTRSLESPVIAANQSKSFRFNESQNPGTRPLMDLTAFDGVSALREHIHALQSLPRSFSKPIPKQNSGVVAITDDHNSGSKSLGKKAPLVMVFKNSPDDWFGLTRLISLKAGVTSLSTGGIICEGFNSEDMAINVKSFLKSFDLADIPVAAGTQYSQKDIESIPNFKLERVISEQQQNGRAFKELAAMTKTEASELESVEKILTTVSTWSRRNEKQFDLMVLGEGIDVIRFINRNPETVDLIGDVFVMGGGRIDPSNGQLVLSRNWLPHREEVISGLDHLGQSAKNVFVFSSNEFGGSIVSTAGGKTGNGTIVFNKLEQKGHNNPALRAVYEHWINWSRVLSWVLGNNSSASFNPEAPVEVATISPLGLFIADEWISGALADGRSNIQFEIVSLSEKTSSTEGPSQQKPYHQGVTWLKRSSGQEIVELARKFGTSVDRLSRSLPAKTYDMAVRETSIFGDEAIDAFKKLQGMSAVPNGDAKSFRKQCLNALNKKQ